MSLLLRYMQPRDIIPVAAIDRTCFQPAWSRDSFLFEIKQSSISHMLVLEQRSPPAALAMAAPDGLLRRLRGRLLGDDEAPAGTGTVLGYGGLWQIADEAHISTIATHPDWRGQGYGELLLAAMCGKAQRLRASYIVLEVRVGNLVAQRLYQKYGFSRVGRRRNYYHNNKEDAWDMRVALDREARQRHGALFAGLRLRHDFVDSYSRSAKPGW